MIPQTAHGWRILIAFTALLILPFILLSIK